MKRATALMLALFVAGCGEGPEATTVDAVVPDSKSAREALEASLSAWRDRGEAQSRIETLPVHLVDHDQRMGHTLESFEIAGGVPSERFPTFSVKLKQRDAENLEETVEYVVAGGSPLWVIRSDEFQMLMHWEHPMDPLGKTASVESDEDTAGKAGEKPTSEEPGHEH